MAKSLYLTDVGKSCPSRNFYMANMSFKAILTKISYLIYSMSRWHCSLFHCFLGRLRKIPKYFASKIVIRPAISYRPLHAFYFYEKKKMKKIPSIYGSSKCSAEPVHLRSRVRLNCCLNTQSMDFN